MILNCYYFISKSTDSHNFIYNNNTNITRYVGLVTYVQNEKNSNLAIDYIFFNKTNHK